MQPRSGIEQHYLWHDILRERAYISLLPLKGVFHIYCSLLGQPLITYIFEKLNKSRERFVSAATLDQTQFAFPNLDVRRKGTSFGRSQI